MVIIELTYIQLKRWKGFPIMNSASDFYLKKAVTMAFSWSKFHVLCNSGNRVLPIAKDCSELVFLFRLFILLTSSEPQNHDVYTPQSIPMYLQYCMWV